MTPKEQTPDVAPPPASTGERGGDERLTLMRRTAESWVAMGERREESRWPDGGALRALIMCGKSLLAMLKIPASEVAYRLAASGERSPRAGTADGGES